MTTKRNRKNQRKQMIHSPMPMLLRSMAAWLLWLLCLAAGISVLAFIAIRGAQATQLPQDGMSCADPAGSGEAMLCLKPPYVRSAYQGQLLYGVVFSVDAGAGPEFPAAVNCTAGTVLIGGETLTVRFDKPRLAVPVLVTQLCGNDLFRGAR